jgi:protein-S-isoprenylcysteine O-methyltransferase Ste14
MNKKYVAALAGALIFVGVPIVAWGISDTRGFLASPARAAYVIMTLLSHILICCFVPNAGLSVGDGQKVVARQRVALVFLQLLPLGVMVVAPLSDRCGRWVLSGEWVRYAGLVVYLSGTCLMSWAVVSLGRFFSVQVTLQAGHRLITNGPYRLIRHPRYFGIFLCFTGISLVFASGAALLVVVALLVVLGWRIRDEEALLATEFGEEWQAYAQKTSRLIPFVF